MKNRPFHTLFNVTLTEMGKKSTHNMDRGSQVLVPAGRRELSSAEQMASCQKQRKRTWRCPRPLRKDRETFWKCGFICTLTTETSRNRCLLCVQFTMYFLRAYLFFPLVVYFAFADSMSKCFYDIHTHTHTHKITA